MGKKLLRNSRGIQKYRPAIRRWFVYPKTVRTPKNVERVRQAVEAAPTRSTRKQARTLEIRSQL